MLETVVLKRIEKTHSTVLYGIIPQLLPDQGQVCGLESKFIKPLKNYSNCKITVKLQSFVSLLLLYFSLILLLILILLVRFFRTQFPHIPCEYLPYNYDALRDLITFAQFKKNVKNTQWVFFTFFKLYKQYQIAQNITTDFIRRK